MDAYIDTEEIVEGIECISAIIENLEALIGVMNIKLNKAGEEFTSINFERASINVKNATESLDLMNSKLETTKSFLGKLVLQIEQYNKLKY